MNLFQSESDRYTQEQLSAREAQRLAEYIAWGPVIFQISRLMVKWGILEALRNSLEGLTLEELAKRTKLSEYALKILLEASLSAGTILINKETDRYTISKTGWFLLNDPATRVNIDFNHDVNYRGMYHLDEALMEGKPAGLKTLGDWPTIYEGLSKLDKQVQDSWFGFDHFYSDHSFDKALKIVFAKNPKHLMDVGGNTGRFALRCVEYDSNVNITIVDLPGQIGMMKENIAGKEGAVRIDGFPTNILDEQNELPQGDWDAIWMSQFLDCFSEQEIYSILSRAAKAMTADTTLYIMETFWDRQKYEPASLCLTMTSVYFTVMANGNSKMYHSDDMFKQVERAGLKVVNIHDEIGQGHTILEVKLK
ncbi:class I SAM-dependent methyltransferase [Prevotella aurantiaca]|jgi:putative O-methyltransferase|uniref:class I SAM-dependent methyltransferase n=1 Tax=Prevotella aurantiaca TaxID=596085 RepID=UPI0023F517EC|nr:class I SAM-dependent methyltransferase [Prevotella aurantiaca]